MLDIKPRRSLPLPELPWRGLLISAVLIAVGGGVYYAYLRPPSQATEVRTVIKKYLTALQSGDGPHACALLTPHARYELVTATTHRGLGGTCVSMIASAGAQLQALLANRPSGSDATLAAMAANTVDAASVTIDPQHTHAVSRPFGRMIGLTRVDGRWLISAAVEPVKRKPSHVTGVKRAFAIRADTICRSQPTPKGLDADLKVDGAAARAGNPPPRLAVDLQRALASEVAGMNRLRQLHAPSMESAQFASYVQSNDAQAATMQRAIALAQTGDPKVIDEVGLVGVLASESAKTAAAMGFRACG